jgi:hypothetical protein
VTPPRLLIVIQQHQRDIYELLRQHLKEDAPVTLIYERRVGERRRGGGAQRTDRRRTDRRQRRPDAWLYDAVILGVDQRDARPPESPAAPRDSTVTVAACPECAAAIEFEMPRFPQPPARLESEVIHSQQSPSAALHYVEIHAFTASGRPLLSHRVQAKRPRR